MKNLVSIAISFLYSKMLLGHKKLEMVQEIKFQDNTKSIRCDCAMQKMTVGRDYC